MTRGPRIIQSLKLTNLRQSAQPLGMTPAVYAEMMATQASITKQFNPPRFYYEPFAWKQAPYSIYDRHLSSRKPIIGEIEDVGIAEFVVQCLNEREKK